MSRQGCNDATASSAAGLNPATLSQKRLLDDGWTQVGTIAAHGKTTYGIDVPTIGDSTEVSGQYYSTFFIRATTAAPTTFFDSALDSGFSVDNLAPGVPGGFACNAGVLSWNKSTAEDFDYFSVYGSSSNSFASATLVDHCVEPTLDMNTSPYMFYFVTATDFSGNEGRPATIRTLSGVGGTPESYVLSISAYPNPFNPSTTIRYTVPSKGRVTIAVYDARGALVTTLIDEEKEAGAFTQAWDGRDDADRAVSSGVYFARIKHAGAIHSAKLVLLK